MRPLAMLRAVEFQKTMASGSSRPAVFLCEDELGNLLEYVTKFRTEIFRQSSGMLFEAVTAKLAEHFGIKTPRPALIQLDAPLAAALSFDPEMSFMIIKNVGLNFGSAFMPGYATWPQYKPIPASLRRAASSILAFDAFIDNGNRIIGNPNILSDSKDIMLIDHELAFQFLNRSSGIEEDIERSILGLRDHPLFSGLRKSMLDLEGFAVKLEELSPERISEICGCLPAEMHGQELNEICDWLSAVQARRKQFIKAVQEVTHEGAIQRI